MFDPIKRPHPAETRALSFNGGVTAMSAQPKAAPSPRIANMLDRVTDLVADANAQLAQMPVLAPERPALMTVRVALLQAQRELTTV